MKIATKRILGYVDDAIGKDIIKGIPHLKKLVARIDEVIEYTCIAVEEVLIKKIESNFHENNGNFIIDKKTWAELKEKLEKKGYETIKECKKIYEGGSQNDKNTV